VTSCGEIFLRVVIAPIGSDLKTWNGVLRRCFRSALGGAVLKRREGGEELEWHYLVCKRVVRVSEVVEAGC